MEERTQAIEQVINSTPWLKQYFVHIPRRFLAQMELITIAADKRIITKTEKNPYIYMMYNGVLRIINEFDNNRVFAFAFKDSPGFSGLLELLSGNELSSSTVMTAKESHFIRIRKPIFMQWMDEDIHAFRLVVKTFANQLYPTFFSMGSAHVYPKFHILVQFIVRNYGHEARKMGKVTIEATREELAENLGLSLRTVYRLCNRLVEEEFAHIAKKKITITSEEVELMHAYLENSFYEQIT
jgi:CRP-like cAMP-binding protein